MTRLHREDGGVIGKLLGLALVIVLILSGIMYVYGKRQQPLTIADVHLGTTAGAGDEDVVKVTPDGQVYLATLVRNDGTLPVTLQGLAEGASPPDQALRAISVGLGDGKTARPDAAAAFTPVGLDPGSSVGVFVVFAVNPELACDRFDDRRSDRLAFPPIPLRFTSYGVEGTQSIELGKDAPRVQGLTRAQCEHAVSP